MDAQLLERARMVLASGVNKPLLEYFQAKLLDVKTSLVMCPEASFKQQQGRALELMEVIKLIESVRE